MTRFHGNVGFVDTEEKAPGVWEPIASERPYTGNVLKDVTRWRDVQEVNDDLTVSNKISILADAFILENAGYMRYVMWMGTPWQIRSLDIRRPRIILTLGGMYNGPVAVTDNSGGNSGV